MMFRFVAAAVMVCSVTPAAFAQDPTRTLPEAYKVELDNAYATVVRVHYDAGVKLPAHTHPGGTTLYVYLNDSDGIVFAHVGGTNRIVTRPAVKAGAMRVSSGTEEHHTAENNSGTPADFLKIYFKTDDGGVRNARQRLAPADTEYSSKQMHISRTIVQPGQKTLIEARNNPALRITVRRGAGQYKPSPDTVRWLEKGTTEEFSVTGDVPMDVIQIDFLTKPK